MRAARAEAVREFAWKVDGKRSAAAADAIMALLDRRVGRVPRPRARDLEIGLGSVLETALRYAVGVRANTTWGEHWIGRRGARAESVAAQLDKEVSRYDVARYAARLRALGIGANPDG